MKVVKASIIVPKTIPIKGISKIFLALIFPTKRINKNVPTSATTNEIAILTNILEPTNNNMAINTPNLAESRVAAVLGDTNLFLESCCMIMPLTLIPTPVKIILIVLGILLLNSNNKAVSSKLTKLLKSRLPTPINIDAIINKMRTVHSTQRFSYLHLISTKSLI